MGADSSAAPAGASWSNNRVETPPICVGSTTPPPSAPSPGSTSGCAAREHARRVGERRAHRGGVRVALGRIRSAGAFDDRTETTELRRREHRCVLARRERADRGVGHRGHGAGDRLDEHDRERVEIGAAVERRARRLLRRRVSRGTDHRAGRFGPTRLGERARQAEVGDPQDAVLVEEEVGRLDVAVHEPSHVRVLERRGDLAADDGWPEPG